MQKTIKVEGQSFDLGFITCHKTVDSFVAQGVKQNLFKGPSQEATLKLVYAKGKEVEKANEEALKKALKNTEPAKADVKTEDKAPKKEDKQG